MPRGSSLLSYGLLHLTLAVYALASLTACVPHHFLDAPAVTGQVVSCATGRPVAGAAVATSCDQRSVRTRTDQRGHFSLPILQHYGFYPLLSEGLSPYPATLHVDAAGYRPFNVESLGSERSSARTLHSGERKDPGNITYERCREGSYPESFYQVRVAVAPDA